MVNEVLRDREPELMSVVDAEHLTGRSRWTWRRDAYEGRIRSVKIGKRLFIPTSEIRRLITEGTRPAVKQ